MELPSKLLGKIAFITRAKIEEHILNIMDKYNHQEHLFQLLQTDNKQFKVAVTFLSAYNGIFNITNLNNKFYFKKGFDEGEFTQIALPPGAYEIESLNDEIKRIIIDKGPYSDSNYPFMIKPKFSILGSVIEINQTGPIISFVLNVGIGKLLGYEETILYHGYNSSPSPVDILSFDNIFIETDVAQGMIFKGKRTGIIHNWTMTVDPGYKYVEKFAGGISWYMMETKDFISSINLKLKNENGNLVSFDGQSVTFRLSIKEV